MLSRWGIEFEAHDVEAEPEALKLLRSLHVLALPAVVIGERAFNGWDPKRLASFVGVPYAEPQRLPQPALVELLDRVLSACQGAFILIPDDLMSFAMMGRERTVRDVGYHIFRLSHAFVQAMECAAFSEDWLGEETPARIVTGRDIASYGEQVRERLKEWRTSAASSSSLIKMPGGGEQTVHELLERTTWHAAQHLRQLYNLMQQMGVEPVEPLTNADFAGLPLPKEIWT